MAKVSARARGVLPSVRPRFRFAERAIVLVSLGVAAIGSSTMIALQREADDARRAELLVTRIGETASNLHDRTWQATDAALDKRLRALIQRDRARLVTTLNSLAALDEDKRRIRVLRRRSNLFLADVDKAVRLSAAGRSKASVREQRRQVVPSFEALQHEVEAASDHYDVQATTAVRNTVLGSVAAIVISALLVALVAIVFGRKRVARERAALDERTALVRLLQSVSASSNAASTLDEALLSALAEICAHTGWPLGHAYLLSDDGSGDLKSAGLWHVEGSHDRFEPFMAATERLRFGSGEGLPGRVLKERRPVWLTSVAGQHAAFPRAPFARQSGIGSAFAFPVFLNGQVVAVLEFFSPRLVTPDPSLLEATAHVGFQLGYLLQRKRAETELRVTEARYRTLVEQLPLATYIDEPSGLGSSTYLSPQIEAMSGYAPQEWLESPGLFQKLVHPDDRERVVGEIQRATRNGEPVEQEYRIVARDGSVHWWRDAAVVVRDEKGEAIYRQGYAIDITGRKEAEDRLREAESRYRTLVEQLPLATYIDALDDSSSAIYMSPQIQAMLGYTPEEWLADKDLFPKLLHPEDHHRVMAEVAESQETGEPFRCEYRLIAKDGRVVWIRDEDVTIRDPAGEPLYAQGYMLDITARKHVEEALELALDRERAANEHLRELDRLKDEFIALVSHELRTPLTSIRGYLEFLREDDAALDAEHARFLAIVDRNAERLQHLVNDLLFVAQVDAGRLSIQHEQVDLSALVTDAVDAARVIAAAKDIDLVLETEPSEPLIGDRARLGQLLDNLVSNAIKFTPSEGEVVVRTWSGSDSACFSVTDSGIGIPEEEQARLFERFYRATSATEQAIPGTGLGLAIAKAIVDAHAGTIAIESRVGIGTTFRVELPLAAGVEQRAA